MIEIRNVDLEKRETTYFCPECERKFGFKVEMTWQSKKARTDSLDKWMDQHEDHGFESHNKLEEAFNDGLDVMKQIYAENPKIKFADAKKEFEARHKKKDLMPLKPETIVEIALRVFPGSTIISSDDF